MKTKYIILTCIIVIVCVKLAFELIPIQSPKQFSREQLNYLNQMFVHHRIVSIEGGSKGKSVFTLKGINYKFKPYLLDPKSRKHFYQIANSGDSLYKPAFSDSIRIIKKDTVMSIYFNKNLE